MTACVVISPASTTRPVVTSVSAATREVLSCARMASRIPSEIWSATLSGWPSETDSEVKRKLLDTLAPFDVVLLRCPLERSGDALAVFPSAMLSRIRPASCRLTRRSRHYRERPRPAHAASAESTTGLPFADGRHRSMLNLLLGLVAALPLRAVHAIGGFFGRVRVLAVADATAAGSIENLAQRGLHGRRDPQARRSPEPAARDSRPRGSGSGRAPT